MRQREEARRETRKHGGKWREERRTEAEGGREGEGRRRDGGRCVVARRRVSEGGWGSRLRQRDVLAEREEGGNVKGRDC